MNRLITPFVYVVGFSVFCACTTTKTVSVDRLQSSDKAGTLELTLTDGSRLTVRDAIADPKKITGLITEDDAVRIDSYFRNWQTSPHRVVSPTNTWSGYNVSIPRSDVGLVKIKSVDTVATTLSVLAGLAVSFLALGFAECSQSGWC